MTVFDLPAGSTVFFEGLIERVDLPSARWRVTVKQDAPGFPLWLAEYEPVPENPEASEAA